MFNWIKDFFKRVFTDRITDKLRFDLVVNEQLQKSNVRWIDGLQKELESLKESHEKHDERIKENKEDILVLDKYDDNAKESIDNIYNKIAELKTELHKLRDGKVNENTQAVKELRKGLTRFKENTLQNITWLDNVTEYLEQEIYSTHPRINPRKLVFQASETSTPETINKTVAKLAIAELAAFMVFPVKKTEFNIRVYEKLKQHIESASRRKSRALVEELISDGWLTETQEVNIKWINVRG